MLTTSAPSRLPAISNDSSVRVEFSKNALMMVRPESTRARLCALAVEFDPLLRLVEQEEDLVPREAARCRAGRDAGRRARPAG